MFLTGVLSGASFHATDPELERDPPPEATPVTFPHHEKYEGRIWTEDAPPPNFQSLFTKVLKPLDIAQQHAEALNIKVSPACSIDNLIPLASDGTSYLLPLQSKESTVPTSYADATKSGIDLSSKQREFDERLSELRVGNDLAFRVLSRTIVKGEKRPRLAFMRKFWEGLDSMVEYWDRSRDRYYEVTDLDPNSEKSAKRQKLDDVSSCRRNSSGPLRSQAQQILPIIGDDENQTLELSKQAHGSGPSPDAVNDNDRRSKSLSATPEPRSRMRYKGKRTSTGREMPDQFRTDTIRSFIEGTVWPFQTLVSPPRTMPVVHFNKLKLPVRQTAAVYRVPKDRIKGRQGWLDGPILGIQVRSETDFEDDDGQQFQGKPRLDSLREIAALLQLAQERRRDGNIEVKPGAGKWWTTNPRWGGGEGGEVQSELGNSDIVQAAEELLGAAREKIGKREKDGSKSRMKKTPAMLWKELKCGRGYWDPKTNYTAIGKDPTSEYDEVFLVSSLNHHLSIVKLTVHDAYVDYITSGELLHPLPDDSEWCRPKLQRSQWFDLFNMEQRVEAFQGLWAVMAYLTRDNRVDAKKEPDGSA